MSSLTLVRHGETAWNEQRRIQGHTDNPLNTRGRAQANYAAELLAQLRITQLLSSPLTRAHETARIIAARHELATTACDPALIERDYGDAEGRTVSEAIERWPDAAYPGSESIFALEKRSAAILERLSDSHDGAVIVGHGAFIRAGVAELTGESVPRIANGQILHLFRDSDGYRWAPHVVTAGVPSPRVMPSVYPTRVPYS